MILESPADLAAAMPRPARLLGLDLGEKTIGLGLSDESRSIASPFDTIKRAKFTQDAEKLEGIIKAQNVGGLVLGLPVNMDGSEGPRAQSTRQFARNLMGRPNIGPDLPILFWDERLSTAAVERMMVSEMDMTRKRRGEVVDKLAAVWILQGVLDAMRRLA